MQYGTSRARALADGLLVGLFLVVLYLPVADKLLKLDHTQAPVEKRVLARMPTVTFTCSAMHDLPKAYEAYFNDHFGFRNALIHGHNYISYRWLRVSSSSRVVIGKGRQLFYAANNALDCYRAVDPFTEEDLQRIQRILEEREQWLSARGIRFLVVIAPSKESIYAECMPDEINRVRADSRFDQLVSYMSARSTVPVLDPREALLAAKKEMPVYGYTDTHWNDFGAHIAYAQIIERISEWYPEAEPAPFSAFEVRRNTRRGSDLAQMLGLDDILLDDYVDLVPRSPRQSEFGDASGLAYLREWGATQPIVMVRPDDNLPRAVMFRDSFAIRLIPFLSETFSRIAYLWEHGFDIPAIEQEDPDVVILEIAERYLLQPSAFPENPIECRLTSQRAGP